MTDRELPPDLEIGSHGKVQLRHDDDVVKPFAHTGTKASKAMREAKERREEFLKILEGGVSIVDACARLGIQKGTYSRWRERFPDFAARADAVRTGQRSAAWQEYRGDFAQFRKRYFHMDTTWFQQKAVDHLEQCNPGEIILLLWPPEHGKTSVIEDFLGYKLALEPNSRITVVSEKQAHAIKVLRRVRNRMEVSGPTREYAIRFGPFAPQNEEGRRQPWTDTHFDVYKRGESFDERDYSCQAVGLTTTIQGVRADWMLLDDIQGVKSLDQTAKYLEILRQDFLSRPGMFGRICFLGTRVGELDIYNALMEEGLIDRLVVFPAHDGNGQWLWPERYTPLMYEKMRKRVGEQAWFRNYMQKPSAAKEAVFNKEMVERCYNPHRSVISLCPKDPANEAGIVPVTVTVDPALGGGNAITAVGFHVKRLIYLSSRVDWGFNRTEEIFAALEDVIFRWNEPGVSHVDEVVIEAMAFQKGLIRDDRMLEMERRHHFRVVPHMTGTNKHDGNLGVASMALSFMRGEIDLPFSDKPSQDEMAELLAELVAWRPNKKGNRLVQDRVMGLWFGWKRWKERRILVTSGRSEWQGDASPLRAGV